MNNVVLIADSSPLIGLSGVAQLSLLPRLYNQIRAPLAVIDELLAGGHKTSGHDFLDQMPWLEHTQAPAGSDPIHDA